MAASLSFPFRIGTIGFSYPGWSGTFYPASLRGGELLPSYASAFETVELDTTFYGTPLPDRIKKWADAVPAGFEFCPKTPRQITHEALLAEGHTRMAEFLRALDPMHTPGKLGPILIQFPPSFANTQTGELDRFLAALPTDHRYAIELRHNSWRTERTAQLLSKHKCAWVGADYSTKAFFPAITANFLYLRFVGQHDFYPTHDRELADPTERLAWWVEQLLAAAPELSPDFTVYALFANDYAGYSPATANRFRQLVSLSPRLPAPDAPPAQGSLF